METRKYQSTDCKEMAELFYHTVHKVNAKDYRKEQLVPVLKKLVITAIRQP